MPCGRPKVIEWGDESCSQGEGDQHDGNLKRPKVIAWRDGSCSQSEGDSPYGHHEISKVTAWGDGSFSQGGKAGASSASFITC